MKLNERAHSSFEEKLGHLHFKDQVAKIAQSSTRFCISYSTTARLKRNQTKIFRMDTEQCIIVRMTRCVHQISCHGCMYHSRSNFRCLKILRTCVLDTSRESSIERFKTYMVSRIVFFTLNRNTILLSSHGLRMEQIRDTYKNY